MATTSDMLEKWCRGQQFNYLITDKKGKLLGAIGIGKINNLDRHVEFGYWLSQDQTVTDI
ncbi:MAG: GNAT family N-acetyltransferase [Alphaproteobacteria bacterium]